VTRLPEIFFLLCVSCSTTSNTPDGSADDAGRTYRDGADKNCVGVGTPNNELGVGGYCDTREDCPMALCTGLFGAPDDAWFCSRLCKIGDNCGSGAVCASDPRGTACVPVVCIKDAGIDASSDTGFDASDATAD